MPSWGVCWGGAVVDQGLSRCRTRCLLAAVLWVGCLMGRLSYGWLPMDPTCGLYIWDCAALVVLAFTGSVCCYVPACLPACVRACCYLQVRHMLACHGRLHEVTQVIVNPSEEPFFNVISTMSNKEDVKVRWHTGCCALLCKGRVPPRCLSLSAVFTC